MKFSIIVALYNKAAYIEETLRSVLAQTASDFEVIVINDGSTDNGPALVTGLGDSRIRLLNQANAGVSAARNRGISAATGEWIAFLDGDDIWLPGYLSAIEAMIASYPDIDVVSTGFHGAADLSIWSRTHAPSQILPNDIQIIDDLPSRWMLGTTFFTSSICARTAILKNMQPCFAVGESHGEDLDVWFRLAEKSRIAYLHKPMAGYRHDTLGSLKKANSSTIPPYVIRMHARAKSGQMSSAISASSLRFVAEQYVIFARDCLIAGNRAEALALLRAAGFQGLRLRRWWMTFMLLLLPARSVGAWQKWRIRLRTAR